MAGFDGDKRTDAGVLFKNEKKTSDNHPDRTGNGELKCPKCGHEWSTWISGWLKKSKKDGSPFMSLAFRPKDQQNGNAQASRDYQRPAPARRDDDVF